jgi:hypothetical protein
MPLMIRYYWAIFKISCVEHWNSCMMAISEYAQSCIYTKRLPIFPKENGKYMPWHKYKKFFLSFKK